MLHTTNSQPRPTSTCLEIAMRRTCKTPPHGNAVPSEEVPIPQPDQVVPRRGEAVEGVAAILVVLLDQKVLRPAGQALLDDRLEVQIALANLGELHNPQEGTHESLIVARLKRLEGVSGELTDAIVLQVDQVHQPGVVPENAHRVLASAMDPVHI